MLQSILEIKDWSPLPALHDILRPRSSSAVVETRPSEAAKAQQQQKKSSVSSVKPKKEVATDEGKSGNDDAKTEENLSPEMPLISVKINHDYSARLIFNTNDEVEV
jgi:hypothetical protein